MENNELDETIVEDYVPLTEEDNEVNDEYEEIEDVDSDEVQDKIDELKDINDMYAWVIDDIISDSEDYEGETLKDRILARCKSIGDSPCVTGNVRSLIYYSDTVAFFNKYADDIYDLIDSYDPEYFLDALKSRVNTTEIILNCDTAKNWIVWMAYEEIAYQLNSALEEI